MPRVPDGERYFRSEEMASLKTLEVQYASPRISPDTEGSSKGESYSHVTISHVS